jgi:DNA-binding MarR family transcriptional regulator
MLRFSEPVLGNTHLSLPSIGALERIARLPGITASELARQTFKTQQAISQLTGRLERLGYIERRLGAGRGVGLHLTSAGTQALAVGVVGEQEFDRRVQELLGADRAAELQGLLIELRERLLDVDPD